MVINCFFQVFLVISLADAAAGTGLCARMTGTAAGVATLAEVEVVTTP